MSDENAVNTRVSTRCSTCRLPVEALAALHDDRFKSGMGFEALAMKYALPDRALSESGVRRHFARHVPEPEWPISEAETPANDSRSGDELDAHAILESSTKALTEMMESLVRQYRATAAQQPYAAERLLTTFMKVQAALARSLKQRDDDQLRREEFRKTVPQIVERCTSEAMLSILPLMRKNMTNLREEVTEYANGTLGVEEFWRRLVRYEVEWPKEVGARMRVAQTQALKAEEVKV